MDNDRLVLGGVPAAFCSVKIVMKRVSPKCMIAVEDRIALDARAHYGDLLSASTDARANANMNSSLKLCAFRICPLKFNFTGCLIPAAWSSRRRCRFSFQFLWYRYGWSGDFQLCFLVGGQCICAFQPPSCQISSCPQE